MREPTQLKAFSGPRVVNMQKVGYPNIVQVGAKTCLLLRCSTPYTRPRVQRWQGHGGHAPLLSPGLDLINVQDSILSFTPAARKEKKHYYYYVEPVGVARQQTIGSSTASRSSSDLGCRPPAAPQTTTSTRGRRTPRGPRWHAAIRQRRETRVVPRRRLQQQHRAASQTPAAHQVRQLGELVGYLPSRGHRGGARRGHWGNVV